MSLDVAQKEWADSFRLLMRSHGDESMREGQQRYFKNSMEFLGIRTADARALTDETYASFPGKSKTSALDLAEDLLSDHVFEISLAALHIVRKWRKGFSADDLQTFKDWYLRHVDNWAIADEIANHLLDKLILDQPSIMDEIRTWTRSDNLWLRRASAVCLVVPMRKMDHLSDVIVISTALLSDNEDLVQKGYGWALKEASKRHPQEVFDFLMENKGIIPRTALRISLEKYPQEMRKKAMAR